MSDKPSRHGVGTNTHVHRKGAIAVWTPRPLRTVPDACDECGAALNGACLERAGDGAHVCCSDCPSCDCAYETPAARGDVAAGAHAQTGGLGRASGAASSSPSQTPRDEGAARFDRWLDEPYSLAKERGAA